MEWIKREECSDCGDERIDVEIECPRCKRLVCRYCGCDACDLKTIAPPCKCATGPLSCLKLQNLERSRLDVHNEAVSGRATWQDVEDASALVYRHLKAAEEWKRKHAEDWRLLTEEVA